MIGQRQSRAHALCYALFMVLLLQAMLCASGKAAASYEPLAADKDTVFLIQATKDGLVDTVGKAGKVSSTGGEVGNDGQGNWYFEMTGDKGQINVPDVTNVSFENGVTVEAYIYLEKPLSKDCAFFLQGGIGSLALAKTSRIRVDWLRLQSEKIYVEPGAKRMDSYGPWSLAGGFAKIPTQQWVHVAFTYDPDMRTYRTWVDRGVDRVAEVQCESPATGPLPLVRMKSPFRFFEGLQDARIGQIKVSSAAIELAPLPPVEIYVNALPWQNKELVTIDRISKKLDLPAEVEVFVEAGEVTLDKRFVLDKRETASFEIPVTWGGGLGIRYSMTVQVYSHNTRVAERNFVLCSYRKPNGPWQIHADRTLSYAGKKVFPIFIVAVFEEDFPFVADLGFTMVVPRDPGRGWYEPHSPDPIMLRILKNAADNKLLAGMPGGTLDNSILAQVWVMRDNASLGVWRAIDEIFGYRLTDRVRESYSAVKLIDSNTPVSGVQNNPTRYKECAMGVDIIAVDPYPIPSVPMRNVYDATRLGLKAGFGRKPVSTTLDCYGPEKIPTEDEFRCMAYLAVIGGANMIGVCSWDDRNKVLQGYYAKDHPEIISLLKAVLSELHRLDAVLPEPNVPNGPVVELKDRGVFAAVKHASGKDYLFLASDMRKEVKFTLSYSPAANAHAKNLSSGNFKSDFDFVGGKAELTLPAIGSAVFELSETAAK